MLKEQRQTPATRAHEPKFYEMDGALRAYANRSIVIASGAILVALVAASGFVFVRMQPPTVIKVDGSGQAQVISPYGTAGPRSLIPTVLAKAGSAEPDEYEKQAFIKRFLVHYLSYDPHSLGQNWADAVNMMTSNLRRSALSQMQANNVVGSLEEEQAMSSLKLSSLDPSKEGPQTYEGFGVRIVHKMVNEHEQTSKLVEQYHIRLVTMPRSASNPDGLLVGEYWSRQIEGEKRDAVLEGASGFQSEGKGGDVQ